jgi:hypothetical protein
MINLDLFVDTGAKQEAEVARLAELGASKQEGTCIRPHFIVFQVSPAETSFASWTSAAHLPTITVHRAPSSCGDGVVDVVQFGQHGGPEVTAYEHRRPGNRPRPAASDSPRMAAGRTCYLR